MMNSFCGMVGKRCLVLFPAGTIVRDPHHCESLTCRAGFESAQNLSSGLVEWSCAVVIALWKSLPNCMGSLVEQVAGLIGTFRSESKICVRWVTCGVFNKMLVWVGTGKEFVVG